MATIRKRGNKYQVQVRRKGHTTVSRSFHRYTDALEWARYMETQADRGDMPTPINALQKYTLRGILERYREEISKNKRSYSNERYVLDGLTKQQFSQIPLNQITTAQICEYRDKRLKVVKPGTVRRELTLLKHAIDIAIREWGIPIRENPMSKITKIKPQKGRSRRLSEEEYAALQAALSKITNPLISSIIHFAIYTGMRRGEILQMKWSDIDLKNRTLHIPVTKNGYARTIPLSSQTIEILKERQKGDYKEKRVFPMTGNGFQQAWERLRNKAGVKDLHFHDLRHEAISRFFERGLSVPEVALISGHRDFRMLFRYTHLKAETVAEKLI